MGHFPTDHLAAYVANHRGEVISDGLSPSVVHKLGIVQHSSNCNLAKTSTSIRQAIRFLWQRRQPSVRQSNFTYCFSLNPKVHNSCRASRCPTFPAWKVSRNVRVLWRNLRILRTSFRYGLFERQRRWQQRRWTRHPNLITILPTAEGYVRQNPPHSRVRVGDFISNYALVVPS